MKLLSAAQIRDWDAYTIAHEPIASIDLMERAAQCCTEWLLRHSFITRPIKIICGTGNNGGDGLAIARQLLAAGIVVEVYQLASETAGSPDFQLNRSRLALPIHLIADTESLPALTASDVVIDALFGSGLNRPLDGVAAALVQHLNDRGVEIVSIDVPSGLFLDRSVKNHAIVRANYTLTFETMKLCFMMPENASYFGEIVVLPIGLDPDYLQHVPSSHCLIEASQVQSLIPTRSPFAHKGSFGHALLIAGGIGKIGAAVLAAKACLRSGIGLLTVHVPEVGRDILQTAVPEAMCTVHEEKITRWETYATIGIGPGIGTGPSAVQQVRQALASTTKPMVLDADALNILALHSELLLQVPAGSILTPHPKEFERLFGGCADDFERMDRAIAMSKRYPFHIILKGHHTLIASEGKCWWNTTGNAGMAKGGSGDVLTGILTALLAQGYAPQQAAIVGVYLHGLAGDIALEIESVYSLLPTDLIANIGKAYRRLAHVGSE